MRQLDVVKSIEVSMATYIYNDEFKAIASRRPPCNNQKSYIVGAHPFSNSLFFIISLL